MAHRLARTGAALAAAAVMMLPVAASADGTHDHASPSADPHAGHDMSSHDRPDEGTADTEHDHDAQDDGHEDHAPAPRQDAHDHGAETEQDQGGHDDHGTSSGPDTGHDDHGATTEDDGGHTDHGTEPDSVSPEVRNLVLSGFAGVNAAVIFGAWMVRRTGPDPDPRKRAPRATS